MRLGSTLTLVLASGAYLAAGCAGAPREQPAFPIFSQSPPRVHAVVAVVDSVDGSPTISARVLDSFYGAPVREIRFCLSHGLVCGGSWQIIRCFGRGPYYYDHNDTRWFAVGDTILAIVPDPQRKGACPDLGFVRWLRGGVDREARSLYYVGHADLAPAEALCTRNPGASWRERYAAVVREWVPDGRTPAGLEAEIVDFYRNRWRESWSRRYYPNPWRPKRPVFPPGETPELYRP